MNIAIDRIYENKEASDNIRILVDRLWPRGISKEDAHLDFWHKQWAPSDDLRKKFHENKISWDEFSKNYKTELNENKHHILSDLEDLDKRKSLTLLYGYKDKTQNHAVLLKEFLDNL
ncbi:DUF488 domain-containing protein [Salegentibacter salegens]|uniref:Uncharacterized conserved protein YeaO, DUF488 family n=1 Tax=Salegentibacter salegens TaxID=143223 RepID=A0A1M7L281_9FLAO|nr:DUF488 family protein [Salegentibacter salegens]PRX44837.1 uncharacterized protein YeaO (DUF488 family) [Salegentibacter salegens]SHM72094.1 Uncharacterized conserved protein YeaO, DUF488 family [Salegentibacter salegens]